MVSAKAGCAFMGFILCISGVRGPAIQICALKASSVDLTCSAQHPTSSMKWYTVHRDDYMQVLNESAKRDGVSYVSEQSDFSLKIKDVTEKKNADKPKPCWRNRIQLHIEGLDDQNYWSMNNVSRRICALEGSTVNISSEYLHPDNQSPKNKVRYKIKSRGPKDAEELTEATGHVKLYDKEYASGNDKERKHKVLVMFTGLKVEFTPSAVVTEGQRVTLTCSTSCPLTDNTNYIWFLNSRLLTRTENQNKQLVLDPVSSQHAGNYYCAVKPQNTSSQEKTLTVQTITRKWIPATAAGVCAALLVLIPLAVWTRMKKSSRQSQRTDASDNMEQLNPGPMYENIYGQQTEQDDQHYSRLHLSDNHTDALYSTIQTMQFK